MTPFIDMHELIDRIPFNLGDNLEYLAALLLEQNVIYLLDTIVDNAINEEELPNGNTIIRTPLLPVPNHRPRP